MLAMTLVTQVIDIYNLTYEHYYIYIYINFKRTSIHNVYQQIDEWILYEKKSLNMKKLNDEWKLIVNDILH